MAVARTNIPASQLYDEEGAIALKKKNELAKKAELLRDIQKLNVQIQAMEREKQTHIFSKRSDFRSEFSCLEEEEAKMLDERKTENIRVKQELKKINHMVKRFHHELRDVKPTPEFVEKLKSTMEEIESAINCFKQQQRLKYEEFLTSEKILSQEIQQLEIKFENWSQRSKQDGAPARPLTVKPLASARDVTKDLPHEVAAFDKFVQQSGGHRGGWDEYDHGTFIKFRNMYKGRIVFLDHVKQRLPTHTETEIREHETWYQEYLFLNENKKCAIKKWRERKEEEKEDAITQVQDELEADKHKGCENQESAAELMREKAARAKQINAWRVQKELEKAMQEEKRARDELEKKKHREEQRKKQLETRKIVEEFQQQRKLEEDIMEMLEEERKRAEEERRREITAKEIGRFHVRDMQRLNEKIGKEREKEEMKKQKERRLEALKSQVQVQVPHDPSRLLQPTSGWKERLKDKTPSGGGQVIHMPHRAIPSWRK